MINIEEIAKKLHGILNGTDPSVAGLTRPTDLYFDVQSAGFHLDHIENNVVGTNFIPVFIDLMGGEYDPIPDLEKGTFTIPVTIFYPVRFKNDFFNLNEYLVKAFVGKVHDYGALTGKCLSTLSVATYGEIQNLDLNQFEEWVENTYQKKIEVMEPYRSMEFTLYLQYGKGLIYGNQIRYQMAYTYDNERYPAEGYYDLKFAESSSGVSNDPISQQLVNKDKFAKSEANITNRSRSILAYVENNEFWSHIIEAYNNGTIDEVLDSIEFVKKYDVTLAGSVATTYTFDKNLLVLSITENNELGSPLSFTFTFGDKI